MEKVCQKKLVLCAKMKTMFLYLILCVLNKTAFSEFDVNGTEVVQTPKSLHASLNEAQELRTKIASDIQSVYNQSVKNFEKQVSEILGVLSSLYETSPGPGYHLDNYACTELGTSEVGEIISDAQQQWMSSYFLVYKNEMNILEKQILQYSSAIEEIQIVAKSGEIINLSQSLVNITSGMNNLQKYYNTLKNEHIAKFKQSWKDIQKLITDHLVPWKLFVHMSKYTCITDFCTAYTKFCLRKNTKNGNITQWIPKIMAEELFDLAVNISIMTDRISWSFYEYEEQEENVKNMLKDISAKYSNKSAVNATKCSDLIESETKTMFDIARNYWNQKCRDASLNVLKQLDNNIQEVYKILENNNSYKAKNIGTSVILKNNLREDILAIRKSLEENVISKNKLECINEAQRDAQETFRKKNHTNLIHSHCFGY